MFLHRFLLCDNHQDEDPEGQNQILKGQLQGGRKHVDDRDARQPEKSVSDEHRKGPGEKTLFPERSARGIEIEPALQPEVTQRDGRDGDQRRVERLIHQNLGGEGLKAGTRSPEIGLKVVKKGHFDTLVSPKKDPEKEFIGRCRLPEQEASEDEGERASESCRGEDGENKTDPLTGFG